jgi:O-antigen ligase
MSGLKPNQRPGFAITLRGQWRAALLQLNMLQQQPALAERFSRVLVGVALATLVLLTLLDNGATRIYATPWNVWFWFVQLVPLVVLALRGVLPGIPLQLPPVTWLLAFAALTVALELAAVFSPFRGVSIVATCTPLATIATCLLVYDWLAHDGGSNPDKLLRASAFFAALLVATSLLRWVGQDLWASVGTTGSLASLLRIQNAHPLGHTSYTAGLALLAIPWPVALAIQSRGRARLFWSLIGALGAGMLLSSGSRGGLLGFGALAFAALWLARWSWSRTLITGLVALLVVAAGAYAHPRTRALLFEPVSSEAAPNLSNVQRTAMAKAGWLMGRARPLLGWGTGTTSRAYPKFRSQLDGGVEDALQLHSTPVQLWADLGLAGTVSVVALATLTIAAAARGRRQNSTGVPSGAFDAAVLTLAGYGTFCLTDYQLDVPVFAFGLAVSAGCVAASAVRGSERAAVEPEATGRTRGEGTPPTTEVRFRGVHYLVAGLAVSPLVLIAAFNKSDPAPELIVRALKVGTDTSQADQAIALLRESLRLNQDQEIAHFNLGWLLVVRDPAEAEQHFLAAAKLVPDKGGVYFGLALARLNRGSVGDTQKATSALALECLNDPLFLVSPWWQNPALRPLRGAATKQMQEMARAITRDARSRKSRYVQRESEYVIALSDWLAGTRSTNDVSSFANTSERKAYFNAALALPDFAKAKARNYRRERVGYPILMRDLDLPAPVDVFDVQENDLAAGELRFLFPPKGWVPSPELVKLLHAE